MIFFIPINPYIKKEDVPQSLKARKFYFLLMPIIFFVVFVFLQLAVGPKMEELYTTLNVQKPIYTVIAPFVSYGSLLVFFVYAIYMYSSKSFDEKVQKKLENYKPGEMIRFSEIVGYSQEVIIFFMLLFVGLSVAAYILPIYQLTSVAK